VAVRCGGGVGSVRAVTHDGGGITAGPGNRLTPPPVSRVEISVQGIWKVLVGDDREG
jgi:hypothetical protein